MKNMILKTGFLASLVLVLALGVTMASQPASAAKGPITDCPSTACPSNLSGWAPDGNCRTEYSPSCIEWCDVFRNTSTGQRCKQTNFCYWQ